MRLSKKGQAAWVRIAYLAPLVTGIALLALALSPRFFYTSEGKPLSDMSLFALLGNIFRSYTEFFGSEESRTPAEFYSSLWAFVFCMLSWICVVLHAVFATMTAILITVTWRGETSPTVNNLKRCYRILVPNRFFYILFNLLPLLPAFFPLILSAIYGSVLNLNTPLSYYGLADPILVGILLALSSLLFLLTLSAQEHLRMDLFRLYKVEK